MKSQITISTWLVETYADDGTVAWSGAFPVWEGDTPLIALQRIAKHCPKIVTGSRTAIIENCAIGRDSFSMIRARTAFSQHQKGMA